MEIKTQFDKVMNNEVRAFIAAVGHPNVVQLIEVINDEEYDKLLLVMEYCDKGRILEW